MKVTVVGAGNVGATCADVLAYREIVNEVILLDIKERLRMLHLHYQHQLLLLS